MRSSVLLLAALSYTTLATIPVPPVKPSVNVVKVKASLPIKAAAHLVAASKVKVPVFKAKMKVSSKSAASDKKTISDTKNTKPSMRPIPPSISTSKTEKEAKEKSNKKHAAALLAISNAQAAQAKQKAIKAQISPLPTKSRNSSSISTQYSRPTASFTIIWSLTANPTPLYSTITTSPTSLPTSSNSTASSASGMITPAPSSRATLYMGMGSSSSTPTPVSASYSSH